MSELKKIAYGEHFWLYVFIDWKLTDELKKRLKGFGFTVKENRYENQKNDDDEISVLVTPESAGVAYSIIKETIQ